MLVSSLTTHTPMRLLSTLRRLSVAAALAGMATAALARPATAQGSGIIRGTVTDSTTQQPIAGAQVQVVGTSLGASTGPTGEYTIRGASGTVTVRVQRIGFIAESRQVTVGAGATASADFRLHPIATTLSQVVVVGYGTESRAQVTGAVSTVSGATITNTPVAGVDAALQGRTPGVQVTQNAGNPGNGISVRVRGSASISASNQPLYVVDGVPIQQEDFSQLGFDGQNLTAVTSIDPDNIESITVLKDAASAAIYGSRASNGVILITTKHGQAGKTRVSFDAYTGTQHVERKLSMLNAQQYVEYMAEGARNDDEDPSDYGLVSGVDDTLNTDWQDAIFRTAPVSNINLGVSGGNDRARYYVSGSYFNQEGIVIGSSYDRGNARANLDFDVTSRLAMTASMALSRERNYRIQGDGSLTGIVTNAIGNQPQFPVRNADGSFTDPDGGLEYPNSVALATFNSSPTTTNRSLANLEARYTITPSLLFTGRLGNDQLTLHERDWESPYVGGTYAASVAGVAKSGYSTGSRFVGEGFFTYNSNFGTANTFGLTAGASQERNSDELNFLRGEEFPSPEFHDAGAGANVTSYDASRTRHALVSYFSRANLSIADRYLLTASVRRDGSSRFGTANRYGTFPAISAGWVLTREPWIGPLSHLGYFKLRASYGVTGNQGISDFAYLSTYGAANYGSTPGIAPSNFGNPNLKWENTKEVDVGFDWTVFGGRLAMVSDYYNKKTSDLLVNVPIPATSGFTNYFTNVGNVENKGFEFQFTSENITSSDKNGFTWTTDANISTNSNRVTALYGGQPIFGGVRSVNSAQVGQPLGEFFLDQFTGVDPQTGDAVYKDVDGDGLITASDRVNAGNPQPTYWGGVTNTFSWHGFDLRGFVQYSGGNKIFDAMRIFADDGGYAYDNKFTTVLTRWQKPGDVTDEPRASFDGTSGARTISTRFLESGSYVRLQEITLGYHLPAALTRNTGLQNARIFVSGHNLHTFTGYHGYNPDVNSNGSSSSLGLGTDFYAYPLARTFSVGISSEW